MVAAELEGKKSRLQPIVKEVKEKHERKEKKDRNRKSPLKVSRVFYPSLCSLYSTLKSP